MKKVLFKLLDKFTEGADVYTHNGSLWLIFTDKKRWIFEIEGEQKLWYNHYFFQECFRYLSLDAYENRDYITEWVENTIQNGVVHTIHGHLERPDPVENTIQNGVVHTTRQNVINRNIIENTIQNGLVHTYQRFLGEQKAVENTIQNGFNTVERIG